MSKKSQEFYSIQHVRDVEDLVPAVDEIESESVQLAPGPFRGKIEIADLGSSLLTKGSIEAPLRISSGIYSKKKLTFAVSTKDSSNIWAHRYKVNTDKLMIWPEGSENVLRVEGAIRWLLIQVTHDELNQLAEVLYHREVDRFGDHHLFVQPDPNCLANLRQTSRKILHMLRQNFPGSQDKNSLKQMHDNLMHELLKSLFSADSPLENRPEPKRIAFQRKFIAAKDYIRSNWHNAISIYDLCLVTGLSERSLRRVFQENLGVSPSEFIRKQRLIDARTKLKRSSNAETTVTAIAQECGFEHPGRFAAYYKQLFGESPSETLRRR